MEYCCGIPGGGGGTCLGGPPAVLGGGPIGGPGGIYIHVYKTVGWAKVCMICFRTATFSHWDKLLYTELDPLTQHLTELYEQLQLPSKICIYIYIC